MIISMRAGATKEEVDHVIEQIGKMGYEAHPIYGKERVVIGAIGDERGKARLHALEAAPGVEQVVPILKPFKLAGRELRSDRSVVRVGDLKVGSDQFVVMAGPCSVESREQILETADAVKKAGAQILRGGAFKPRTSPYSFQGLEEEGLKLLAEAREKTGLRIVTEVMTPEDIPLVSKYTDILQVGARNMQNFVLLKRLGQARRPVLLKRSMMGTVQELLMSAEYIISQGNSDVILCERGIRTFETYTRNTFDLSAIPLLHQLTHLPVIADPSHGTGVRSLIPTMSKAAVAAGADGLMVEVHPNPEEAFSDGAQSLMPREFVELMADVRRYLPLEKRHL
ncbi:MAG: 3-deoxy-7-phosphoheptulonate synthase [Acidobacteria bacterium]|nr:3-deoxy-7-phosphoheptulonate synthase [Acidobacteriota bacterium]